LEVEQTRDADHDETVETPERRRNRQAPGERQLGNMWWHGPEVGAALELTAEQIESMDQIFLELRAERQEARSGTREATQRLVEAAAEGDAARIDSLLASLSDQRSAAAVTDTETARQVLALLTEEQLKTLAERFPVVLERPWVLRLGGDSPRKAIRDAQRRPRPARRQATPGPEDAKPQN
jgi:Spy/CpxP family protein refolding chaperone